MWIKEAGSENDPALALHFLVNSFSQAMIYNFFDHLEGRVKVVVASTSDFGIISPFSGGRFLPVAVTVPLIPWNRPVP